MDFAEDKNSKLYWDPFGEEVNVNRFSESLNKLLLRHKELKLNPKKPFKYLLFLILVPITLISLFIVQVIFSGDRINAALENSLMLYFIFIPLSFLPIKIYWQKIKSLEGDIVKSLIAKENGWAYSDMANYGRFLKISQLLNYFIDKRGLRLPWKETKPFNITGGYSTRVEDELWGTFNINNNNYNFWCGLYKYEIKVGKKSEEYVDSIFTFKLNKGLTDSFCFYTKSWDKFFSYSNSKTMELKTESLDFNGKFISITDEITHGKRSELLEILTPSVMVNLLDLTKKYPRFAIEWRENFLAIALPGDLLKTSKTNFFKSPEIHPQDKVKILQILEDLFTGVSGIIKYFD